MGLSKKSFDAPDEHVEMSGVTADVVEIADSTISRNAFLTGVHCPQISVEGKPLCMAHHTGFVVGGRLHVEMQDGSVMEVGPNDVFDIPPGHDGWVISDEPWLAVNWAGFRSWAPGRIGERVLVTILFTDIVGSTERAVALGDRAWGDVLARHYRAVRVALDRYRGREIDTAGDGFLAVFDGAGRAIDAASAIRDAARKDDLSIRAGIHSGEVEIVGDAVRGVAVHQASRIAGLAGSDEILVSEATRMLAAGGAFDFDARGPFVLKGLPGTHTLFVARRSATS
ncbi:MAG TPA: adenylate/guanylate cyclase domain-containing protein [Candidatus Limnocylindrales bacterium]|nr:adenylate/guanylate cyclase domain-containing protein [Candidatus Limnocylindrales bacterium]